MKSEVAVAKLLSELAACITTVLGSWAVELNPAI